MTAKPPKPTIKEATTIEVAVEKTTAGKPTTWIGIDPGYDRIGWAIGSIRQDRQLEIKDYGCLETTRQKPLVERFQELDNQLTKLVKSHHITQAAVETLFFARNTTTAINVSQARGVILSCLFRTQVKIFDYNPTQIKLAVTGNGRASKGAVAKMVRLQTKLPPGRQLDDALDAIATLITHHVTMQGAAALERSYG